MGTSTKLIVQDVLEKDLLKAFSYIAKDVRFYPSSSKSYFSEATGSLLFNYDNSNYSVYASLSKMIYKTKNEDGKEVIYNNMKEYPFIKQDPNSTMWWIDMRFSDDAIKILSFVGFVLDGWVNKNDSKDYAKYRKIKFTKKEKKEYIKNIFTKS